MLSNIGLCNIFLNLSLQAREKKKKNKWIGLYQTKKLLHSEGKGNILNRMRCLQMIYPMGLMSKYKEYSQLNIKNANNPIKNGQTTWIDIFLRKTPRWPMDTWKDAQHHRLSVKCKWGVTSYLSEWLLSKRSQITSAGEGEQKRQLLCTIGRNVNWYSHYGKQHGGFSKIKIKLP